MTRRELVNALLRWPADAEIEIVDVDAEDFGIGDKVWLEIDEVEIPSVVQANKHCLIYGGEVMNIPYAENLLAYIEQRGIEIDDKESRTKFAHNELIWMRGYIQALNDYKVKGKEEYNELKNQLRIIIDSLE